MSKEIISNEGNKRFEIYKIAFNMLDRESTLFWQRAYIFLLIHGAFIAMIGIRAVDPILFILFGIFGITFSLIWIAVLKKGQEYVYRWIRVINKLEKELKIKDKEKYLFEMHATEGKIDSIKTKFPKFFRKRTTTLIQYVIVSICIFWILIMIYGIYIAVKIYNTCTILV